MVELNSTTSVVAQMLIVYHSLKKLRSSVYSKESALTKEWSHLCSWLLAGELCLIEVFFYLEWSWLRAAVLAWGLVLSQKPTT